MSKNQGELLLVPIDFRTVAYLLQQLVFSENDEIEISFIIDRPSLNRYMERTHGYLARKELTEDSISMRKLS